MTRIAKVENAKKELTSAQFTKEQILQFKKYETRRDLLKALLLEDKKYSKEEIEEAIKNFMKGKVK